MPFVVEEDYIIKTAIINESMGSAKLRWLSLLCLLCYTTLPFVSSGEVPTFYVRLGEEVTIPCELDELETEIQWTKGANYDESQVNLIAYNLGGIEDGDCVVSGKCALSGRDLVVRNVDVSDQGGYYCSASGKEYTEQMLSILIEPNLPYPRINFCGDEQNCIFSFPIGYPMWLRCEVSGSLPAVDLVWYNGSDVIDYIKPEIKENIQGTYDSVSRLKIDYSTHTVFTCEAVGKSIPDDHIATAAIHFTEHELLDAEVEPMKPYPRITQCDDEVNCTYIFPNGYNLFLTCEVEGSRTPVHLKWTNGTDEYESKVNLYSITGGLFNTISTLKMEHNEPTVYYCVSSEMLLPGTGNASITVTDTGLPVAAAQEGLSGGSKTAVAAGSAAVSAGVILVVARKPIMKTSCCIMKKIPRVVGEDSESLSSSSSSPRRRRVARLKRRRKQKDVEANLEEDEEFIDEEEVEDEEVTVAEETMLMKGVQPTDDFESNGEEEEKETTEDDVDEHEGEEIKEHIEDKTLLSQDEITTEDSASKTEIPILGISSLLQGPKHGLDSLKSSIMDKVDDVTSSGKDFIGKHVPTSTDKLMDNIEATVTKKTQQVQETVTNKANELQDSLEDKAKGIQTSIEDNVTKLQTSVEDKAKELQTSVEDKAKRLQTSVENKAEELQSSVEDKAKEMQTSVEDKAKELHMSVEDKAKELHTSVEDKAKELQTYVEDKAKGL